MIPQPTNITEVDKHFKTVPNQAIQPVKRTIAQGIDPATIKNTLENFWQSRGTKYYNTYQTGKLLAASSTKPTLNEILQDLSSVVAEAIRAGNQKNEITSEKLKDHFELNSKSMKLLASSLNELYARINSENASDKAFDHIEILAALSGYITTKVYGG